MIGVVFQASLRYTGVVVGLLSIVLLKGCQSIPPEYDAFFAQDLEQQRQQARGFSVEKQIEYYLAGKRYVHPPSSTLLHVIAERGKEAVPPLLKKMFTAPTARLMLIMAGSNSGIIPTAIANAKRNESITGRSR